MKDFAKKLYNTQSWKDCRAFVWSRDHGLCVDCSKKGLTTPAEEVHHIIELTPDNVNDPTVSLNPDNLVSLCRECHRARHNKQVHPRYIIDEFGRVQPIPGA